jgi:hypothetical protein
LDHAPQEILIGPGMPPQEALTEPHFPLVSIQYERTTEACDIASFEPLERVLQRNMKLERCFHVSIEYNSEVGKENKNI